MLPSANRLLGPLGPVLAIASVLAAAPLVEVDRAQPQPRPGGPGLHEFILVKVIPGMRQEFIEFLEKEYMPLQRPNEFIKRRTVYLEDAGAEWDFIVILTYDDYTALDNSKRRYEELMRQTYPAEAERLKYLKRFQGLVDRHQHMFYREMPRLSM